MAAAENTAGKQRGSPFKKGQSGNPRGKPQGARHRATQAIEELLEGEAGAIGRKVIEKALEGDATGLRLAMERISPLRKGRPVRFSMPDIGTASDVERSWRDLKGHFLAHQTFADADHLERAIHNAIADMNVERQALLCTNLRIAA
jgi:uncharacterized protein DUF5681